MKITERKFLDTITPSCHASSTVFYRGKMYAAWFGGTREGAPDVCIYLNNGEKTKTIGDRFRIPCWNPIWHVDGDDLYLFYKVGEFCDRWQTFVARLDEDLNMLSTPQLIPAGLNGPVKTKPIAIDDKIYCGSSVETSLDWASYIETYKIVNKEWVFLDRSKPLVIPKVIYVTDNGMKRVSNGLIQPALWTRYGDDIHMFMRSSRGLTQLYYASWIDDYTQPTPVLNIPNPNSSVDVVCHDDRLFLACNPDPIERSPLVIYEIEMKDSEDLAGRLFDIENLSGDMIDSSKKAVRCNVIDTLEIGMYDDVDEDCMTRELSYPYLIENEGTLYLSYTYGRTKIEVCTVEI